MPKSYFSAECGCPIDTLIQKKIETTQIDEHSKIIEITTFEIGYCKEHNCYGGKQKKFRQEKKVDEIISVELNPNEINILKYLLYILNNKTSISAKKFRELLLKKRLISNEKDYLSIELHLMQAKFLILENIKRDKPIWKIMISSEHEENLRKKFDIFPKEHYYPYWKKLITDSISSKHNPNDSEIILKNILLNEQKRLVNGDPGFYRNDQSRIVPENNYFKIGKYEILLNAMCTWYKIWQPMLSVRELSARSVFQIAEKNGISPSKLLEQSYSDLSEILEYERKTTPLDLGLINGLKFIHYFGNLSIDNGMNENRTFKSFSSLDLTQLKDKTIKIEAKNILYIENLSAFMHIANDFDSNNFNEWLVVYGNGKFTEFPVEIILRLTKSSNIHNIFLWVDNDLGGLQIISYILNIFSKKNPNFTNFSCLYRIPSNLLHYCYKKNDEKYWNRLEKEIKNSKYNIIPIIGEYIKDTGLLEQEVLLSDYKTFFMENNINLKFKCINL